MVDPVMVDQEAIYAPRHGCDRLLLGLEGSLNEYDWVYCATLALGPCEKARRTEFVGTGIVMREDPDRRSRKRSWCSTS